MATEENNVTILAWPKEKLGVEHSFDDEKPCPVKISFVENAPAHVIVHADERDPFHVDMNMNVKARETIPICIKVCEPICVRSDYDIGITVFDRPTAAITVRGQTKIHMCKEEAPSKRLCVNFDGMKTLTFFAEPLNLKGLTFVPLGEGLRLVDYGDPTGKVKLNFRNEGLRIEFNASVHDVRLFVNCYAGNSLDVTAYSGESIVEQQTIEISNQAKEVLIAAAGVTAVAIKGGRGEASLVEVCYEP